MKNCPYRYLVVLILILVILGVGCSYPSLATGADECGLFTDNCYCWRENPYPCCHHGNYVYTDKNDGNCTWWAWHMMCCHWEWSSTNRAPLNWGNPETWLTEAFDDDFPTGTEPKANSVFVWPNYGTKGHVGWVFKVDGNDVYTTEMQCYGSEQYTNENGPENKDQGYSKRSRATMISLGTRYIYEKGSIPTPPTPPTHVYPTQNVTIDTLTPTFTWNRVSNADHYGLYISEPPYGENYLVFNSREDYGYIYGTSFHLPTGKLARGVTYYWNMQSYNSEGGWGSFSTSSNFTTSAQATPPTVNAFSVGPDSVVLGRSFTISCTVSDTGGSGLNWVEIWRATDTNSDGKPDWPDTYVEIHYLSGQTNFSRVFFDRPPSVGTYWYGLHVGDNNGNWSLEPKPPGPIEVTVVEPCTYSISSSSEYFSYSGGMNTVGVITQSGCSWTATTYESWINITSGSSGSGNGTVYYSVDANSGTSSRTGTMNIAGKTFTVNQDRMEELNCKIELRKQNTTTLIDTVLVNESFDMYVGVSSGNIDEVRFSSDEDQNRVGTGRWTDWYEWDTPSEGDWNAETKAMSWTFTTSGEKEVCAEIRDGTGSVKCFANMSAQAPIWRRFIQPGDILYDPCTLIGNLGHVGIYIGDGWTADPRPDGCRHRITTWDYPARKKVQILRVQCPEGYSSCAADAAEWARRVSDPDRDYSYQIPIASFKPEKDPDENETEWYCSELVWAAYFNYGIDIEAFPGNISTNYYNANVPVSPNEICEDGDVYPIGGHTNGVTQVVLKGQCDCSEHVSIRATCPVDLVITDPDGLTIDKDSSEIPDAIYWIDELGGDDSLDVLVTLRRKEGTYQIRVVPRTEDTGPRPQAEPADTYTLVFKDSSTDQETVLAREKLVKDIPDEPYQVRTSDGGNERDVIIGPNPVSNTGTAFFYSLPVGTSTAKLMIFSATSSRLLFETSIDVTQTRFPATGTWDPVDDDGVRLANGPYIYVLIANGQLIGQGKMVIQW